jgi:hypothetical protein
MSADNGIYILETVDGFRVMYGHAVSNTKNEYEIYKFFKSAKHYNTRADALYYAAGFADVAEDLHGGTEDGILFICYRNYHWDDIVERNQGKNESRSVFEGGLRSLH